MNTIAVYIIRSKINNKIYIGGSKHYHRRIANHRFELANNKHPNKKLQRHVNKYGIGDLCSGILEIIIDENKIRERELYFIDILNPYFNICVPNMKRTKKDRMNMSKAHLGYKASEEQRANMSKAQKGKTRTKEHIQKLHDGRNRKKITQETRDKMSKSAKGRKMTEENKYKLSQRMKGNTYNKKK